MENQTIKRKITTTNSNRAAEQTQGLNSVGKLISHLFSKSPRFLSTF